MSKNVPAEVKEPIEEHLFQTLYSNQERINYADLLINIIEIIRSSHQQQQQQQNDQLNYNSNSKKTLNINIKRFDLLQNWIFKYTSFDLLIVFLASSVIKNRRNNQVVVIYAIKVR